MIMKNFRFKKEKKRNILDLKIEKSFRKITFTEDHTIFDYKIILTGSKCISPMSVLLTDEKLLDIILKNLTVFYLT